MDVPFIQLIQNFCALVRLPDPDHVLRGGSITVDGVLFSLTDTKRQGHPSLLVRCDFGELPDERLADVCKALLAANWYMYDGAGPAFSLCPKSSHVLFAKSYPLDTLTPHSLHGLCIRLAAQVHAWREQGFLESLPQARKRRPEWAARQIGTASNFQQRS